MKRDRVHEPSQPLATHRAATHPTASRLLVCQPPAGRASPDQTSPDRPSSGGLSARQTSLAALHPAGPGRPTDDSEVVHARMLDLVKRMRSGDLTARRDPIDPDFVILVRQREGASLSAGRALRSLAELAVEAQLIRRQASGRYVLCGLEPGGATPGTRPAGDAHSPQPPHAADRPSAAPLTVSHAAAPVMNDAESPLLWLHRRKGPDGRPLLDEACFLAGERFRRDVTQAAMLPNVTTNWSRFEAATSSAAPRDPALASDAVIAARQRVRAAYRMLGSDMGNFVLDTCAFLAPLQEAEHRRSWPARSGKLVLKLALTQLAAHYGIETEARGRPRADISAWHAGQERAGMQAWLQRTDC